MKVREERVLTDRKLAKGDGQIDELLAACRRSLLEPDDPGDPHRR